MAQYHAGIVVLHTGHGGDEVLQIQCRLWHTEQQQFEFSVVHPYTGGIQLHQAAQGGGIAHSAENELPLEALTIGIHRAAVGPQGVQIAQPLQNVGKMTQGVLGRLGGGVGGPGKGPKGGHIGEIAVVMPPHVQGAGRAGGGRLCRGGQHGVKMQAHGKVVGAAAGQIAQQGPLLQLHKPGQRLVQRAVASGTDHHVVLPAPPGGDIAGLAARLGDIGPYQIAGTGELRHGIEQRGAGFCLSRTGIDDKQELFHRDTLPYHRNSRILRGVVRV